MNNHTIKINLIGGIVAAGDLYDILNAAEKAAATNIQFGNRQQLFFRIPAEMLEDLEYDFLQTNIPYEVDTDIFPNIVSSYVAEEVFENSNWVREGVYKDILDLFDFAPKLKINIVDNSQSFVPFFTGNLNFISSEISNYWYLYIRFPKTTITYCWPVLIYSEDISTISKVIESLVFANKHLYFDQLEIHGHILYNQVNSKHEFITEPYFEPIKLPAFQLPYYEGFNRYDNKLWLGIFRRDELFSIAFLKDICNACMQTRLGQLCTTPWKSIIIKGIEQPDQKLWNTVLAKHRINVRHASNELNWQLEDLCDYGLNLKRYLVKAFDEIDLRTYRLCFAIKTQPKTGLFGSVIIRKQVQKPSEPGIEDLFDILHTRDFNPNSKDFIVFKSDVKKEQLVALIVTLCDNFYTQQTQPNILFDQIIEQEAEEKPLEFVYQCKHCLTVYDVDYGDELNNVSVGTPFDELKTDYLCPTCDSPISDYISVEKPRTVHL